MDMAELAVITKGLHFHLEQVQDFTPTPMTLATEMYYTGYPSLYIRKNIYGTHPKSKSSPSGNFSFGTNPNSVGKSSKHFKDGGGKTLIDRLFRKNRENGKG